jgi:hypothetical protein
LHRQAALRSSDEKSKANRKHGALIVHWQKSTDSTHGHQILDQLETSLHVHLNPPRFNMNTNRMCSEHGYSVFAMLFVQFLFESGHVWRNQTPE